MTQSTGKPGNLHINLHLTMYNEYLKFENITRLNTQRLFFLIRVFLYLTALVY